MTKAVISNRIYLKPENPLQKEYIINALTYKIEKKHAAGAKAKFSPIEIIKNYKMLPNGIISLPQGRTDLIPDGYEIVDKRVFVDAPFPVAKHGLREGQQVVYDEVSDTCFINALVGWGKTFTALHIAKKLGQRTLIVTHTTMIRDQWIKEIDSLFGIKAGIIGSGLFDIEDHAIVVGNVQSVIKYSLELSKEFGLVILDEAHHVPADTFGKVIDAMYARYRIALSGTMERSDGKHVVFQDYFGFKVYRPPQSHTLNPIVKLIPTGIRIPSGLPWVKKLNHLLYDDEYQRFVATIAKVQMTKGHKVLIVASRVDFLHNVRNLIGQENCVLITGATSFEERGKLIEEVETGAKSCIVGSKQIFSEGISVNVLSSVILPEPGANLISLEQIIGRIMRLHKDKITPPEVLDLQFSSSAERKQDQMRVAFYTGKGWEVQKF